MPDLKQKQTESFLERAAQSYASQVPSISAHLMHQAANRPEDTKAPKNRLRSCQACGTILNPDLTSKTSVIRTQKSGPALRKARGPNIGEGVSVSSKMQKYVKVECLVCHRYEKSKIDATPPRLDRHKNVSSRKPEMRSHQALSGITRELGADTTSANKNSKTRAKARKQSGLQAILDKSKQAARTETGTDLDLMDLMKQG